VGPEGYDPSPPSYELDALPSVLRALHLLFTAVKNFSNDVRTKFQYVRQERLHRLVTEMKEV
jgi:hypothetical protein